LEFDFKSKRLALLYESGKSKKYKLPKNIVEKFIRVVAILEAAHDIYDLWKEPSLNFEKLKGGVNSFSARLSKQWRLEMKIEWKDKGKTMGFILITDITSHYGD